MRFHSGIDLACDPGTPIHATADGIVSHSGWAGGNGNVVVLEHGHGYSTIYAHNRNNAVKVGQQVRRGDVIGYVGSTGRTTGPHVHYEVLKDGKNVNPAPYLAGRGT
jgi:murein DD-endopeptidase MepM/ murein hydrolase activator NlpD